MATIRIPVTDCYTIEGGTGRFLLNDELVAAYGHGSSKVGFSPIDTSVLDNNEFVSFKLYFANRSGSNGPVAVCPLLERVDETNPTKTMGYDGPGYIDTGTGENAGYVFSVDQIPDVKRIVANGCALYGVSNYGATFYSTRTEIESNRPYAELIYNTESDPPFCKPRAPVNTAVDGAKELTFLWHYSQSLNRAQTHFDLQYRQDGSAWTSLYNKKAGTEPSCEILANALPAGNVYWRIRTYCNNGETVSEWSTEAAIVVRRSPDRPVITAVDDKPRPIIAWQSVGQQAFRVTAGEYDSGQVFGTAKSFRVRDYLPDGETTVTVRVQNNFGLWSAPAMVSTVIHNQPGAEIIPYIRPWQNEAAVSWAAEGYEKYYVLRDGVPVAKTTGHAWTDHTSVGKHAYQVMGVTAGDYYGKSKAVTEILEVRDAVIADVETFGWFPLRCRRDAYPGHNHTVARQASYQHYDGRRLPVAQISGYEDAVHRLDYSLPKDGEREAWAKLRALVGQTVIYKDCYGRRFFGVLESVEAERDWASDVSLTITEIDYREEVDYEV